jgi:hypothetical protein
MLHTDPVIAHPNGPAFLRGRGLSQSNLSSPATLTRSLSPVAPTIQAHRHERTPSEEARREMEHKRNIVKGIFIPALFFSPPLRAGWTPQSPAIARDGESGGHRHRLRLSFLYPKPVLAVANEQAS